MTVDTFSQLCKVKHEIILSLFFHQ